jgi:hypothetical protein
MADRSRTEETTMSRLFYIHWNERELQERILPLAEAGHDVGGHWSTEETADLRSSLPDALIVSLDRLPSHGRAYAEWLWEAKSRRQIPIVFVGGKPDKVAAAREKFPEARFCASENLQSALASLGL